VDHTWTISNITLRLVMVVTRLYAVVDNAVIVNISI